VLAPANSVASLFLRHVGAYGELIAEELGLAYAAFLRRLMAGLVLIAAGAFSIAMACVWAIAVTWSTPGRMWLIAGLFGLFVVTSVASLLVFKAPRNEPQRLLARTRLEWQKDRLLLDDLLLRSSGKPE
jgi:uncharacterized membrane protein YqjE